MPEFEGIKKTQSEHGEKFIDILGHFDSFAKSQTLTAESAYLTRPGTGPSSFMVLQSLSTIVNEQETRET